MVKGRSREASPIQNPLIAVTMGDINGVGPEILAKVLADAGRLRKARLIVIGDSRAYDEARKFVRGAPDLCRVASLEEAASVVGGLSLLDGGLSAPRLQWGKLDPEAGRCAVEWVKLGVRLAIEGQVDGIVTCPLNKEGIHRAGYSYAGHTELIAEETGTRDYRMGLFSSAMRIVHNTAHCSLRQAIELTRSPRIVTTIRIADRALQRLGLRQRRIAVCGLNPHAGENGAFGSEEIDEIQPAVQLSRKSGVDCSGPFPADTIFNRMRAGQFDLVVAMYHDQGHGPMKLVAMDEGVNVTLGVPIVRTSVDHGTAYDIAGKGIARPDSLGAAIDLAVQFARTR